MALNECYSAICDFWEANVKYIIILDELNEKGDHYYAD